MDGNWLKRVPSEALKGPAALQNLHLEDNVIGELVGRVGMGKAFSIVPLSDQHIRPVGPGRRHQLSYVPIVVRPCPAKCNNTEIPDMNRARTPARTRPPAQHPIAAYPPIKPHCCTPAGKDSQEESVQAFKFLLNN